MQEHSAKKTLLQIGNFLEKIAEKSEYVYWLSSPTLDKIIYISPAYEKIWGRPRKELYDEPTLWADFLHPDDRKDRHPIENLAQRVAKEGDKTRFEENYRIIRPDGTIRWILDRGFPIFTEEGEICGVTGVAIDVTKERQVEERLREAKAAAEAANQAKTKFLSNVSHELRTPLYGIIGMIEVLEHRELPNEIIEMVKDVQKLADDLLYLVNDILCVANLEGGSLKILISPIDIQSLVISIVGQMKYRLEKKPLSLHASFEKNIPLIIETDQARFRQILTNLIDNAIKFTEQGKITVHVSVENQRKGHCILRVEVSDTGIGMDAEFLKNIFERFTQANDKVYIRDYGGVGLGLSICKELVTLLNGNIDVKSKINKGSTFIFTLPVKYHNTALPRPKLAKKSRIKKLPSIHLLLVEDERINQKVMKFMLENLDCTYDIAETGKQALDLCLSNHYDLILMDIQLPDTSGVQVTKSLRASGIDTPIIATTAHVFPEERESFLAAGVNAVLTKPFNQRQILDVVAQWTKRPTGVI